jgi:chromosome segregation ATPase
LRELEARLQAALSDAAKLTQTAERLQRKEAEVARLEADLKALAEKAARSDGAEAAESQLASLRAERDSLLSASEAQLANAQQLAEQLISADAGKSELESQCASLQAKVCDLGSEIERLRGLAEQSDVAHEAAVRALEAAGEDSRSRLAEQQDQLDDLSGRLREKGEAVEAMKKDHLSSLESVKSESLSSAAELQKNFDGMLASLKEDHKAVLAKFSQKLKEAKSKEKTDAASLEALRSDLEQSKQAADAAAKKLDDLTALLAEKEDSLSKLREEHQNRYLVSIFCFLKNTKKLNSVFRKGIAFRVCRYFCEKNHRMASKN